MFKATELVEFCKTLVGMPYWYGTYVNPCTEAKLKSKSNQYPSHYTSSRMATYRKHIEKGYVCMDCVGMIKGFFWTNGGQGVQEYLKNKTAYQNTYKSNGCPDTSANGMLSFCKKNGGKYGKIATLPQDVPGILLFSSGHVGVYIGNGEAVEARGFNYGVVRTKVASRTWTDWAYCPLLDYQSTTSAKKEEETTTKLGSRVLKKGMEGEDVKELQTRLIALGYSMPKYGADGEYGSETASAVKAFQKANGLTANGQFSIPDLTVLETAEKNPSKTVKIVNGNCNVRTEGKLSGSIIGVAHRNETYSYAGETNSAGWNKIIFKGKTGWVSGKYSKVG